MEFERKAMMEQQEDSEEEVDISKVQKASTITVDDIAKQMSSKMKIGKKKKGEAADQVMEPTKKITKEDKQRKLKNKHKNKRSREMLKF